MFRGVNALNLDAKGRMALPTRYRDSVQSSCDGKMVVTVDTEEKCLLLYPLPDWEVIESKIEALPSFNRHARKVQRLLIGHANDVELDASGRFLVPPMLRQYAELDKRVVLVGQGKKFEIWDEDVWNRERDAWLTPNDDDGDDMPEELLSLSL